jgi:hypothetical protein
MGLRTLRSRLRVLIAAILLSLTLKQFITIVFVQLGYELTIIGLLEIELISYLLRNGSHLLQQLRVLLICTVGGYPASDYFHRRL